MDRIDFRRTDEYFPNMEKKAGILAEFVLNELDYLQPFIALMRNSSGWRFSNYKEKFNEWKKNYLGRTKLKDPKAQDFLLKALELFKTCKDDEEIGKARGTAPEKLVEKIFRARYHAFDGYCKHGQGCIVIIKNEDVLEEVLYKCKEPFETNDDCDDDRQTVDIGVWNGRKGEFAEIKLSPRGFRTKDIRYLETLKENLTENNIDFIIYLISLDNKDLVRRRLINLDLAINEFILVGTDELLDYREAI